MKYRMTYLANTFTRSLGEYHVLVILISKIWIPSTQTNSPRSFMIIASPTRCYISDNHPTSFPMIRILSNRGWANTTTPSCSIIYAQSTSLNCENPEDFTVSLNLIFHEWDAAQVHEWTIAERKSISLVHPENESQGTTLKMRSSRFPLKNEVLTSIFQIS